MRRVCAEGHPTMRGGGENDAAASALFGGLAASACASARALAKEDASRRNAVRGLSQFGPRARRRAPRPNPHHKSQTRRSTPARVTESSIPCRPKESRPIFPSTLRHQRVTCDGPNHALPAPTMCLTKQRSAAPCRSVSRLIVPSERPGGHARTMPSVERCHTPKAFKSARPWAAMTVRQFHDPNVRVSPPDARVEKPENLRKPSQLQRIYPGYLTLRESRRGQPLHQLRPIFSHALV